MTRAYLRLDPAYFERKAIVQAYPAGAALALVGCLCLAESQPERGRFRNERLLRALLEGYGKWVPFLIEHRDLIVLDDGRLYVEGWDEWQEGDWKVGERVQRIRGRKGGPGNGAKRAEVTVPTVTGDTVPTVYTPSERGIAVAVGIAVAGHSGAGHSGTAPPPPVERGLIAKGPTLRVSGTNPRLKGENPRSTGTNPRQVRADRKRGAMPESVNAVLRRAAAEGRSS